MLNIHQLHKRFSANTVLKGLDLSIEEGAMTAIIGPNGCGKSTLFNLITGELAADAGEVIFCGQSLKGLKPRRIAQRGLLRKFQIPGVYPRMTVAEHLQLAFVVTKKKVNATEIKRIAEQMGLSALMNTPAAILATGQKQWLEMAMLVLLRPRLLLLDEPIAGMTAEEAEKTQQILQQLNNDGLTIVTIEHNIDFVKSLTDDIAVLMNGKIYLRDNYQTIVNNSTVRENYLGTLYV